MENIIEIKVMFGNSFYFLFSIFLGKYKKKIVFLK